MRIYNESMITTLPVTMNTTITSNPSEVNSIYGFAIQAVWTGTPNGTFKLQASCDPLKSLQSNYAPTNWTDVTGSLQTVNAAGNFMWNINGCFYNWIRLVYTDASGGISTASLTVVTINSKGV